MSCAHSVGGNKQYNNQKILVGLNPSGAVNLSSCRLCFFYPATTSQYTLYNTHSESRIYFDTGELDGVERFR